MNSSSPPESDTLAAVFHGPGKPLELSHLPIPEVQAGEALVRVECCTICGSDLHTVSGKRSEKAPSILGHEIIGHIETVGSPPLCDLGGKPLAPGERVTWSVAVSCGECDRCRQGLPQKCRSLSKYGHELCAGREALSGGLAERILLRPGTAVVKIPDDLPAEVICPVSCATATVAAAYRKVGDTRRGGTESHESPGGWGRSAAEPPEPSTSGGSLRSTPATQSGLEATLNTNVLIFGAGMLGITAAAMAKSLNTQSVIVCDVDPVRLAQVKQFGADVTIEWTPDPEVLQERLTRQAGMDSFDVVLELSGSPDAVEAACGLTGVGGQIVLVGSVMKSRSVAIDPESVVRRCLSIYGVHNYAPQDIETAVGFLIQNHSRYPFADLVRQSYPLTEINLAIETALQERPVRVAVRP